MKRSHGLMGLVSALLLSSAVSLGCGHSDHKADAATTAQADHHGHKDHEGHGEKCAAHEGDKPAEAAGGHHKINWVAGSPASRFHDVFKPLWHAEPSAQRTTDTCAALPGLLAIAGEFGQKPELADKGRVLVDALNAVQAECASDKANFEPKLKAAHEAFHAVAEAAGG